ncbi:MAG: DUF2490 domain-containing protein [Ferruginibacter sp.]
MVILKMCRYFILALLFITFSGPLFSQEQRLADYNSIGWLVYTGTFRIKPKIAIHTEYQWRRVDEVKNWQQGLFRTGINYAVRKDVSVNAGYAFAETYAYGDYPAAFAFPEHRIFEQVLIKNPVGSIDLSHRFTLEQRFIGRITMPNGIKNTEYIFLNRMRYRIRGEIPLHKKEAAKKTWSIIAQDEVFIGWGKNMGANIFDQNRLAVLLGYKLNQTIKFEAGYLNQILQQGKRVNDKDVFQYNNGFMLATHVSLSFIK